MKSSISLFREHPGLGGTVTGFIQDETLANLQRRL